MRNMDGKTVLITGASRGIGAEAARVFAKAGANVALVAPNAGSIGELATEIGEQALASYTVQWYNPRTGGALQNGTVTSVSGPGSQSIGMPPADADKDWVALVRAEKVVFEETGGIVAVEAEHFTAQDRTDIRKWYQTTASNTPTVLCVNSI